MCIATIVVTNKTTNKQGKGEDLYHILKSVLFLPVTIFEQNSR